MPTLKKTPPKKAPASKLLIQTAQEVAEEEDRIASKWEQIFDTNAGQLVLFKTVKDKKQKIYGWAAEDGLFMRGIKYKNEIFAENMGWPDLEMASNNQEDAAEEAKRPFKKPRFSTDTELWIFNAKDCLVLPHSAAREKLAHKFNSLLGEDMMLQEKHLELEDEFGSGHKKVETNLDKIDAIQLKISEILKALKK